MKENPSENECKRTFSNQLDYIGFSQHDCEAYYKCPYCGVIYGGWSIPVNELFTCKKCKKLVWTH